MQVLFISYDGMTDTLGQSQVLPYLVGLSQLGYQITIVSAEKKENFEKRKDIIEQITQNASIDWQYIFYTKKPPIFSTLYDVYRLKKKVKIICKEKNIKILHCRSYISALIGLALQKKMQVKFLFDMRGFWADERVDGGLWNLKNPLFRKVYHFFKEKEKQFIQKADYIISLTHEAKKEIESWHLKEKHNIEVIPCCVDINVFDYQKTSHIPKNKDFTISYLGSLGTWYMLPEMIDLFKVIKEKYVNAHFLLITPDSPTLVEEEISKKNLDKKDFTIQSAERKEVPQLLAKSHLNLFFVKPAYSKKASSPTKMGEVLAAGLPIIANTNVGDNQYLFEKYNCGVLLDEFSTKEYNNITNQIEKILTIPKENLKNIAEEYFSLEKGIRKYANVYRFLIEKK
ncbi:MAG: glycosyltransferase [Cytophagales bacterium]|nr:MAG: glycosyltransferase [Cytophagales bacterium]